VPSHTPIASDTDSVAGRPSGTSATITPRANTNDATAGWPVGTRTANIAAPIVSATAETRRAIDATCRCSGLRGCAAASASRKIRPNSVAVPVANTTPLAVPAATVVPMNTQLAACNAGVIASTGPLTRFTGSLSPVSAALFTAASWASTSRQSAGTASPASSTTTSPGTSSRAGTSDRPPSRSTRQVCGTIACNAWAVRSAEYSCQNPMTAFNTTTARIATASCRLPKSRGRCTA
jgi:hypothetical protein